MFKRGNDSPDNTDTIVGAGSVFQGELRSSAGIRVEGTVNGAIETKGDVTVVEHGKVESHVTARNLIVAGSVIGSARVLGLTTITASGKLLGDLETGSIVIEEGGVYEGNCRMLPKEEAADSGQAKQAVPDKRKQPEKNAG